MGGEEGHDELLEELGWVLGEECLHGLAQQFQIALLLKQPVEDEERFDAAVMAALRAAWTGAWWQVGRHSFFYSEKLPFQLSLSV